MKYCVIARSLIVLPYLCLFLLFSCSRTGLDLDFPHNVSLHVDSTIIDNGIPFICTSNLSGVWNSSWKLVPLDSLDSEFKNIVSFLDSHPIPNGSLDFSNGGTVKDTVRCYDFIDYSGYRGNLRLDLTLSQESDTLCLSSVFHGLPSLSFVAYDNFGNEIYRRNNISSLDNGLVIDWPLSRVYGFTPGNVMFTFRTTPFFFDMVSVVSGKGFERDDSYSFSLKGGSKCIDNKNPCMYTFFYDIPDAFNGLIGDTFYISLKVQDDLRFYAFPVGNDDDLSMRFVCRPGIFDKYNNSFTDVVVNDLNANVIVKSKARLRYVDDLSLYETNPGMVNTDRHNYIDESFEIDTTFAVVFHPGEISSLTSTDLIYGESALLNGDFGSYAFGSKFISSVDISMRDFLGLVSKESVYYQGEEEDVYTGLKRPIWRKEMSWAEYDLLDIEIEFENQWRYKVVTPYVSYNHLSGNLNLITKGSWMFSESYRPLMLDKLLNVYVSGIEESFFCEEYE